VKTGDSRAVTAVRRALEDLPGVVVSPKNGRGRNGVEVRLARQKPLRLDLVWLPEGWPSDVKNALGQLTGSSDRSLVIAAPALSPGAIEELRTRGINWVDELGNVRLVVPPGLAIVKTAPPTRRAAPSFRWSRSKVMIAEILLSETTVRHRLEPISSGTGISKPQASNVLRAFDKHGWTNRHGPKRGSGVWREVVKPGSMLESWTAHLKGARPESCSGHRIFRDAMLFLENELAPVLRRRTEWAVTGWAGASLLVPSVTFVPVLHLYIPGEDFGRVAEEVFHAAKIRPVDSGSNIEIWKAERPLILHNARETNLPVVSLPRLYADLMAMGGRGEDAARNVRETAIGY
jgi:hypothetical protein